jgi:hypothetical protein
MARLMARLFPKSDPVILECNDSAKNVTISVTIPVPTVEECRDCVENVGISVGIPALIPMAHIGFAWRTSWRISRSILTSDVGNQSGW